MYFRMHIYYIISQRLLTQGVPEDLQQWTETNSVNNLRYYTSTLNVPFEDIQRYLVYRIPNSTIEKRESSENNSEVNFSFPHEYQYYFYK